ncbi:hypothetical protein [Moraxella sp.]|uniref:hypothetical protein n=1 Tax=Moraxella sp. TaxID=479 RepID=UPI0026DCF5FB|nr:hypothetical protein [Moraxella sp.]MDO4895033.1 hypothetical protein [Moraxella sp.]
MNNNNESKYPTLKVIMLYPLLGGLVGGVVVLPFLLPAGLDWIAFFLIIAWLVGLTPALLAGIMLAYFKIRILNPEHYLKAFFIGCLATLLPSLLTSLIALIGESSVNHLIRFVGGSILFSIIGGVSSAILAKFILPKY